MTSPIVVIMAKQPAAGRTKTRLCPPLSPAEAASLAAAFLSDTAARVAGLHSVSLAVAVTPPAATDAMRPRLPGRALLVPVDGTDLGDCLSQAIEHLFALGFRRVIALNADGPTLPTAHIERAVTLLGRHDVVLGPSEDGGYYLIGLRSACPELFRDVEWSTAHVMAQTMERAAALGFSVAVLPPWYDVDTATDLDRLRSDLAGLPDEALPSTRRFFAGRDTRRVMTAPVVPHAHDRVTVSRHEEVE